METFLIRACTKELIDYLMGENMLKRERQCGNCSYFMQLVTYKKSIDKYAWRCMNKTCQKYKNYESIRKDSFFEKFRLDLTLILRITIKYGVRQAMHSIKNSLDCNPKYIECVILKIKSLIPICDFSNNKLGGPGFVVQIDETMLNFKVKSHRGRSPNNRSDSLCIVEVRNGIERAFATLIPNKSQETILPIITRQVSSNSTIWTDEHRSYSNLSQLGFFHQTVCHKYEFVNSSNGVNTQSIESFHNEMKNEIKRRKGVKTENRSDFLKEFCFYFNNRSCFFDAVLNLIKI
ncbi:hypothetical protein H312_02477 [Anncaliia algerae PRA339]|uniref:ISXO2-like transposase domain-containing protein n=1 Tax=Anncaliia algerae PRA339 TaxID=1288291 RepID=A0A059EYY9_9MICR|nr:hypothetical protein H312_02477 [Anncaliia algerae PRA339]